MRESRVREIIREEQADREYAARKEEWWLMFASTAGIPKKHQGAFIAEIKSTIMSPVPFGLLSVVQTTDYYRALKK